MRARGEAGLTLNELLIAILITAIIIPSIAGAIFVSLHTSTATQNRIQESAGANVLASFFGTDVQNAVTVAAPGTEASAICGASASNVDLLLTTGSNTSVSYVRGTGTDKNILFRRSCDSGVATTTPVVRSLAAPSSAVTFTCLPDCGSVTWRTVTGTVTQSDVLNPGAFSTTVLGTRRVS